MQLTQSNVQWIEVQHNFFVKFFFALKYNDLHH